MRRGGWVAETKRLLNARSSKRATAGSNPALSASFKPSLAALQKVRSHFPLDLQPKQTYPLNLLQAHSFDSKSLVPVSNNFRFLTGINWYCSYWKDFYSFILASFRTGKHSSSSKCDQSVYNFNRALGDGTSSQTYCIKANITKTSEYMAKE